MSDDLIARAKAALEGVTGGPWKAVNVGNIHWGVSNKGYDFPTVVTAQCSYDGFGNGSLRVDAEFIAAARTLVPALVAEVEQLRDGLARIENFSRLQALSDRVRTGPAAAGHHSEERYWLDLLAIIERAQGGAS